MHIGVKGNCIYFVYPPTESNITCINNYVIETAVKDALGAAGVTIYQDALLAQWNDGQDPDPIHSACFTTSTKPFRLECSVSPSLWTALTVRSARALTSQGFGTPKDFCGALTAVDLGHVFKLFRLSFTSSKKCLPTWLLNKTIYYYHYLLLLFGVLPGPTRQFPQEISCEAELRQRTDWII